MKKASRILIFCIILIAILAVIGVSCGADRRTVIKIAPCDSRQINESYELKYKIIYDDLTTSDEWVNVTKDEYDYYEKLKNSGG